MAAPRPTVAQLVARALRGSPSQHAPPLEMREIAMTGRPPLYPSGALIPVGVRLDQDTIIKARKLGGGNLSAGIRLAVGLAPLESTQEPAPIPDSLPAAESLQDDPS